MFLGCLSMYYDVTMNFVYAFTVIQSLFNHSLIHLGGATDPKHQLLIAEESLVGNKCSDWPKFVAQFNLMKSPLHVQFSTDGTPIQIMEDLVHRGNRVSISFNCTVYLSHVNAQTRSPLGLGATTTTGETHGVGASALSITPRFSSSSRLISNFSLKLQGARRIGCTTGLTL